MQSLSKIQCDLHAMIPNLWEPHLASNEVIQAVFDAIRLERISAGSNIYRLEEECCHLLESCHIIAINTWIAVLFSALKIFGYYPSFHFTRFYREKYGFQQDNFLRAEWISNPMRPWLLTAKMTPGDAEYMVEPIQLSLTQWGW